jgi:hypothetical protein
MARDSKRRAPHVSEAEAERDRVVATLRHHYAAGRLSLEDFSARVDAAYSARDVDEVQDTLRGLSAGPLAARTASPLATAFRHEGFLITAAVFAVIEVFFVAVWAAAGAAYFWPIWPALVCAFILALVLVGLTAEAAQRRRKRARRAVR